MCIWDLREIVTYRMAVGSKNWKHSLEGKITRHNFKILTRLKLGAHICRLCNKKKRLEKKNRFAMALALSAVLYQDPCTQVHLYRRNVIIRPRTTRWSGWFWSESPWKFFAEVLQRDLFFLLASWLWRWWNFSVKQYIRVVQEGVKEYLFGVHVPSVRCTRKSVSERGASRRRGYRDIFALYFIGTKRKLERWWYELTSRTRLWCRWWKLTKLGEYPRENPYGY